MATDSVGNVRPPFGRDEKKTPVLQGLESLANIVRPTGVGVAACRLCHCLALLTCMVVAPAAQAAMSPDERAALLRDAVQSFDEGTAVGRTQPDLAVTSFRAAAQGFEALVADGVVNGRLLYNLGNTYLQLGDIGKAILIFRRAERLIGGDPQLRHNLSYARSLRRNQIDEAGERAALHTVFFWHYETSLQSRYAAAVAGYVLFWGLLLARGWVRGASLRLAIAACGVLWLAAGSSVAIETVQSKSIKEGVTTASDIVVRKGNGEGYDPQFAESLHEGVEFRVIDERGGWYKIELPDGNSGWIRQTQAEII